MKTGWRKGTLSEFFETVTGNTPSKHNAAFYGDGVPLIKPPELTGGMLYEASDNLTQLGAQSARVLPVNSVLVSCIGNLGKIGMNAVPVAFNQQINAILPRPELFDPRFTFYFTHSEMFSEQLEAGASGTTVAIVNKSRFNTIEIPLPPLDEQKRIVEILDAAFEGLSRARAHTETNLQNARELFESGLLEVFGDLNDPNDQKLLRDMSVEFGRGKSKHRPRNDKALYEGEYPFIQTGDVRNSRHIIESHSQTYNEFGLAQSKLWPAGTVCITIAANIAETGVLGFDACFPDSIIGMVPDASKTNSTYVEYLLQFFQKRLKALGEGSAQQNINLATFETEYFPFPPLPIQEDAIARLSQLRSTVEDLESHYRAKLADLDALRQALLQKAFAGELS